MSRPTYTVLAKDDRGKRAIYKVLADNVAGVRDFVVNTSGILPGSTVDVADLQAVFRLRNDGKWEQFKSYAEELAVAVAVQGPLVTEVFEILNSTASNSDS